MDKSFGNMSIETGGIIGDAETGKIYRVVHIRYPSVILCRMEVDKLEITVHSAAGLQERMAAGRITMMPPDEFVYEDKALSEEQKKMFELRRDFVMEVKFETER